MNYEWLLFDIDGTLFDYDNAESAALARTFQQMALPFEPGTIQTYRRINEQLWREFEQGRRSQKKLKTERFGLLFEALGLRSDPALFSQRYLRNLATGTELFDGAQEVVEALYGHIGLLLITNGLTEVQRPRLKRSTIGGYFSDMVISEEVGSSKPDSGIFDVAFQKMGQSGKEAVLIVGDSLTSDMQGANNYGIDACWYNPGKRPNTLGLRIEYEIECLDELLPIVDLVSVGSRHSWRTLPCAAGFGQGQCEGCQCSCWNASTLLAQAIDRGNTMQGKVCMVTGATSGIGLATARALAQKGATVVVVGRNAEKGNAVVAQIKEESGNPAVDLLLADLSIQAQVRQLAQAFEERYPRLDVLVNNAGGSYIKRRETAEGIELTWALNYLCPFLLTSLLLDTLQASAPSRIVNVLSDILRSASIDLYDLQAEKKYSTMRSYGQSKLALLYYTYDLARRLEGTQVTVNALHPGFVATEIFAKSGGISRLMAPLIKRMAMSPEEGAETSIYLASSPDVAGVSGQYFAKKQAVSPAPVPYDEEVARRLWEISAEMTGLVGDRVANEPRLDDPVEALHGKVEAGPSSTRDLLAEQERERSQEDGTGG